MQKKEDLPITLKLREIVKNSKCVLIEGDRIRNAKLKEEAWGNPFEYKDYFAYGVVPKDIERYSPVLLLRDLREVMSDFGFILSFFHNRPEKKIRIEPGKIQQSNNGSLPKTYVHFPFISVNVENPLDNSALDEVINKRYSPNTIQKKLEEKDRITVADIFFYPSESYANRALGNELLLERIPRYNNEFEIIKKYF